MHDFRLIAIDLDGTLLGNDNLISPRARESIRKARDMGVEVTLCTGRMYRSALPYAQQLGLSLPLITYQGALVKHSGTGEVLYERSVPAEWATKVVRMGRAWELPVNVYYEDELFVEYTTPQSRLYASRVGVKIHEVGDLLEFIGNERPIKLLVVETKEDKMLKFERACQEYFGTNLYITRSMAEYLEFLHPEATKGRGLAAVAENEDISREQIVCIGDSYNDLEMFSYAGFAVAMGNARPEIKAQADYVTSANDDDGVAEAIEKLILDRL